MHCYICDAELKETEVVFNRTLVEFEPCRKCLHEIHNIKYPPIIKNEPEGEPSDKEPLEDD